jgi:hypothetical protein
MAAAKKGAAPKAAPKPKAPAAPQAPQAEAAAAPAGPAAETGSAAPGADQAAGDGGPLAGSVEAAVAAVAAAAGAQANAQAGSPDGPDEPQGASPELAEGEVAVSCIKRLERFHRAGLRFTREPRVLTLADLPPGTLERLEEEPNLVVVRG